MAYYTALIAGWNGNTPPSGVVGTALTGLTTAQKIAAINGWTVTATIPAQYTITGAQIAGCIKWSEFAALTATQQAQILAMCAIPGPLSVGSSAAEIALLFDGMIVAYFGSGSVTVANLSALATAAQAFSGATAEGLPTFALKAGTSASVTEIAVALGFASSRGEARRLIEQGGVRLNEETVRSATASVTEADLDAGGAARLSVGKKRHGLIRRE